MDIKELKAHIENNRLPKLGSKIKKRHSDIEHTI